jgi:RNA polymerase sigma-70 factor, ECF subfamily
MAAHALDTSGLPAHIDRLNRAARTLCASPHDAEDLVQDTFVNVLRRPRFVRDGDEVGYLLRALRNTHASRYRSAMRRPAVRQLFEEDAPQTESPPVAAREVVEAIASAPPPYRDAVIAVDFVGLSYREAARSLKTQEATITSRLHRGRLHVTRALADAA